MIALTSTLPNGVGSIYTVTINWNDNRDGSVNNNDPNFQTGFRL